MEDLKDIKWENEVFSRCGTCAGVNLKKAEIVFNLTTAMQNGIGSGTDFGNFTLCSQSRQFTFNRGVFALKIIRI